jgi:hypothetical protein
MAADLTENSSIPHTYVHDLESVFWVLIWVVVSYIPTAWEINERSSFLKETMCPKVYGDSGGGTAKRDFLQGGRAPPVPHAIQIEELLWALSRLLSPRLKKLHAEIIPRNWVLAPMKRAEGDNEEKPNVTPEPYEMFPGGLDNHDIIIGLFSGAISQPGWPEGDAAKLQPKLPSTAELRFLRTGSMRSRSQAEKIGVFVLPS